ncbi:hypothetical protein [Streptomyces sp. NPDC058955]|uniref:hypothetical protein n=1 Tax=unclassified Streptomyces TaxID=2593676 RepID=UPI00365040C7
MSTSPLPASPAVDRKPPHRVRIAALTLGMVAVVGLIAVLAKGCESMAGGPVRSEAAFREHLRHTEEAGEGAVRLLGADPDSVIYGKEMGGASCKDDLGVDAEGVTRDQPVVTWKPDFASDARYRAALGTLRREWAARGLDVKDIPAREQGEPGAGPAGVSATDDHGVEVSLRPDWYSGEPVLTADGGCVRHHGYLVEWE